MYFAESHYCCLSFLKSQSFIILYLCFLVTYECYIADQDLTSKLSGMSQIMFIHHTTLCKVFTEHRESYICIKQNAT